MNTAHPSIELDFCHRSFCVLTGFAARNYIILNVATRIIYSVYAIVLCYSVKYLGTVKPRFISSLLRFKSTIVAIFHYYLTEFIKREVERETANFGIFDVVSKHIAEIGRTFRLTRSRMLRKRFNEIATAASYSSFDKMTGSHDCATPTGTGAFPHNVASVFGLNRMVVIFNFKPSECFSY
jgi:hypothetical protein